MKIVQIFRPQRGSIRKISLREKLTLSLNFDLAGIETMQEGNDLLFVFPDGSIVLLEDFYTTKNPPMFLLASGELVTSFEDMVASAEGQLPPVETSTEGQASSGENVLSMPVAAGPNQISNGGFGEYRDQQGNLVGAIDRLDTVGTNFGDNNGNNGGFLGDNIGPTGAIPNITPPPLPPVTGKLPSWSEIVRNPALNGGVEGGGLQTVVGMLPSAGLATGTGKTYSKVEIDLTSGWNTNDTISIGGKSITFGTSFDEVITIGTDSIRVRYDATTNKIIIAVVGGASLTPEQINGILGELGYTNLNIGRNDLFEAGTTGDRPVDNGYLSQIEVGFKGLTVSGITTAPDGTIVKETVSADVDFRDLNKDPLTGPITPATGKDIFVEGTAGADSIVVNGDGSGKNHFIMGGDGNDTIVTTGNDDYLVVANGAYTSGNTTASAAGGTVDATIGTGNNSITTGTGNDTIIAGTGNDFINAGAGENLVITGGGNATVGVGAGNNTIVLNGDIKNTTTKGDNLTITDDFTNGDKIYSSYVEDTVGATIRQDTVILQGNMHGGLINTGNGNDSIVLEKDMNGGLIEGGLGDDTIAIKGNMNGGTIDGGTGNDTFGIHTNMNNGTVSGGEGNDYIWVGGALNNGIINMGSGIDTVVVEDKMTGGEIILGGTTGAGNTIELIQNGAVATVTLTGGLVNIGNHDHDPAGSVPINPTKDVLLGGTITGSDYQDAIQIHGNMIGGIINTGAGSDTVLIHGALKGGTINLGDATTAEGNLIEVGEHKHDVVGGSPSSEDIMLGGTIQGGAGADSITIHGNMVGGKIDGGAGTDYIHIHGNVSGNATIEGGEGKDTIHIEGTLTDSTINLDKDDDVLILGGKDFVENATWPDGTVMSVDHNATIMNNAVVNFGNFNNAFTAHGDIIGKSTVNMGGGNNTLDLHGSLKDTSLVTVGAGSNTINIAGRVEDNATVSLVASTGNNSITIGTGYGLNEAGQLIDKDGNIIIPPIGRDPVKFPGDNEVIRDNALIEGGAFKDTIAVYGDMVGGTIKSGAGDDSIFIQGAVAGGVIDGGTGNDTINILNMQTGSTAIVYGGEGNDKVFVTNMNGGTVDGGVGDDTIWVRNVMTGGLLDGGDGNDSIEIGKHTTVVGGTDSLNVLMGGSIHGGAGNDTIVVHGNVQNTTIRGDSLTTPEGQAGNDSIEIHGSMFGGLIDGGAGNDSISVDSMHGGLIDGGTGNDSIYVKEMGGVGSLIQAGSGNDTIRIDSVHSGRVDGGDGNDVFVIKSIGVNVTLNGDAGANSFYVDDMHGGTINVGLGSGFVDIKNMASGATVNAGNNADEINVGVMSGTINAGGGADDIRVNILAGGTINLNGGNNHCYVGGITGTTTHTGTINGGDGSDKIYLNSVGDYKGLNIVGMDANDKIILDMEGKINLSELPNISANAKIYCESSKTEIILDNIGPADALRIFDSSGKLTVELDTWSRVKFSTDSNWKFTKENTAEYTLPDGKVVTIEFVSSGGGSTIAGIHPDMAYRPITLALDNEETAIISPLSSAQEEDAKREGENQVARVVAVAMAVALNTEDIVVVAPPVQTEEAEKDVLPVLPSQNITEVVVGTKPSVQPETKNVTEEVKEEAILPNNTVQEAEATLPDDIFAKDEDIVELEEVKIIAQDGVQEEVASISAITIDTPISLVFEEEISFEDDVLENITLNVEGDLEEEALVLLPQGMDLDLEVTVHDLIVENSSSDIPRMEAEAEIGIYSSTENNMWYASELEALPNTAESASYSIDDTKGIQFALHNPEVQTFTLEETQIISFEFVTPSMEVQYDEANVIL